MQVMNTLSPTREQPQAAVVLPAAPKVWMPAHYFHRVHDPASFAWLERLSPTVATQSPPLGNCFGMEVAYLALDLLHWFPSETVLAIPFLEAVPPEYFLVCSSGGQRWWCFVVLRNRAEKACALVFDIDPSVLLIAGLGLRETHIEAATEAVTCGRDFSLAPNAAVLCPMDQRPIRYERLSPATQEYFCLSEGAAMGNAPGAPPGLADLLTPRSLPQTAAMEGSIGSRTLGLRMRVNDDDALMRFLDSLGGDSAGGVL